MCFNASIDKHFCVVFSDNFRLHSLHAQVEVIYCIFEITYIDIFENRPRFMSSLPFFISNLTFWTDDRFNGWVGRKTTIFYTALSSKTPIFRAANG